LRREDVAALAGISADYYAQLERGRLPDASDSVVAAIARALQLGEPDRLFLWALARPGTDRSYSPAWYDDPEDRLTPRLLELFRGVPAAILDRSLAVRDWNPLFEAVVRPAFPDANLGRFVFLHPAAPALLPDRPAIMDAMTASLHAHSALYPEDQALAATVAELQGASAEFRAAWARFDVAFPAGAGMRIDHPDVGLLELTSYPRPSPARPDLWLWFALPEPGTPTVARLAALAELVEPPAAPSA
jgi:transcriptional regulator with XRE-family HTH domain